MTEARRVIRITGHVQGVNFRRSTRREAQRLGLSGLARNEPDGSVTVDVEGDADAIEHLVAWCRRGPDGARVAGLDVSSLPLAGHVGFTVE